MGGARVQKPVRYLGVLIREQQDRPRAVSYTHLRAHETVLDIVCRLLLEKKNNHTKNEYADVTTTQQYYVSNLYPQEPPT